VAPGPRFQMLRLSPRSGAIAGGLLLAALFPVLPFVEDSLVGSANVGAAYALVAISLVVLTGWVGQISLGHAAFVGVGAYGTGWAASALHVPFPLSAPIAGLAGAAAAILLGAVALRVRGLYLAVATLIFSWMADTYLFRQPWVAKFGTIPSRRIGGQFELGSFDLTNRIALFYLSWALVVLGVLIASNVRDSKTGRSFFAVRGSEVAAASLGIDVIRIKLMAFALSGFLAGVAGSVIMGTGRTLSPDQFTFNVSLFYLAIAVVGGIRSLPGAIGSAALFASLTEVFFRVAALGGYLDVVSSGLLVAVLLLHRGGLAALAQQGVDAVSRRLGFAERSAVSDEPTDEDLEHVADIVHAEALRPVKKEPVVLPPSREDRKVIVRADHLTVRFGGLTAVNDVCLDVREGEIVGLIGPNGAGKTVTFNSIAGLVVPTEGKIELFGQDVTDKPVHERARLGVARTFQLIQLFPQLSVRENLMVATHGQNSTGFMSNLFVTERSIAEESAARERVDAVIERMNLQAVVNSRVGDLPFGVLRMVEVARALVTGYRFVMLDEPASGLDNRETDGLVEVMKQLHNDGITLLLIEHDVKMVTSVSDYIYVLDRGRLISEGLAKDVARDPAVVTAYIGKSAGDSEEEAVA
jgi:branched-chain amino acid transport system permease protein